MKNKAFLLLLLSNFYVIFATPPQNAYQSNTQHEKAERFYTCAATQKSLLYLQEIIPTATLSDDQKLLHLLKIEKYTTKLNQLECADYDLTVITQYAKALKAHETACQEVDKAFQKYQAFLQSHYAALGLSASTFNSIMREIDRAYRDDLETI